MNIIPASVTAASLSSDMSALLLPAGIIFPYGGATPPSGYLLCDGSAVSRTTYATLFAAIGTTWGVGDNSTTFNVPDFRGRALIGSGTGTALTARTLGQQSIGAETHTLATGELPSHTHPPGASATYFITQGLALQGFNGGTNHTTNAVTGSTGSGTAHANMQPSAVVHYIIKT